MPDVLGEAGLLGGVRQGKASAKKEDHAPGETFLNWEIFFRGREWSTIGHDGQCCSDGKPGETDPFKRGSDQMITVFQLNRWMI